MEVREGGLMVRLDDARQGVDVRVNLLAVVFAVERVR